MPGDNFDAVIEALTSARFHGDSRRLHVVEVGQTYFKGTTAPVLGDELLPTRSGLLVPRTTLLATAAPIDFVGSFVTFEEVCGVVIPINQIVTRLRQFRLSELLSLIAIMTYDLHHEADRVRRLEDDFTPAWNDPGHRRAYALLLGDGHPVLTSPALSVLTKLALLHVDEAGEIPAPSLLVELCLQMNDHLDSDSGDDDPDRLRAEVVAIQSHWRSVRIPSAGSLFVDRWLRPTIATGLDVPIQYENAVGQPLEVLTAVAIGLLAPIMRKRQPVVDRTLFRHLGFEAKQVTATLKTISATIPQMNRMIVEESATDGDLRWNFSCFDRFPVIRLPGNRFVVTDDFRLVRKAFGWGVIYEATEPMSRSRREAFLHQVAHQAEVYALACLERVYGADGTRRLFVEEDIRRAFPGDGIRVADAAIDFGTDWVVVEVCSARPARLAITRADPAAFRAMIEQILEEADQAYSTARQLAQRPEILAARAVRGVPIWPVVVMTEGFPVNPIVHERVRRSIRERGWASGCRIEDVEVIDQEELSMIEQLAEAGIGLPDLLRRKQASNFRYDSLRNFILTSSDLEAVLDPRRETAWTSLFDDVTKRMAAHGH